MKHEITCVRLPINVSGGKRLRENQEGDQLDTHRKKQVRIDDKIKYETSQTFASIYVSKSETKTGIFRPK